MNRKKITKAALSGLVAVTMVPAMAAPLVANAEGNDATAETTNKQVSILVDFVDQQGEMVDQALVSLEAKTYPDYTVLAGYVPEGYEMVSQGQQWTAVEDGALTVVVQKAKATTKTIEVNYAADDGNYFTGYVEVSSGADTVNESQLTDIPKGYVINKNDPAYDGGDFVINDKYIYVPVTTVETVNVTLEFNDENGNVVGQPVDCQVPTGWQSPSVLEEFVPEGYTLLEVNNINFVEGGYYNIDVKKNEAETKEVTINLIDEETKEILVTKKMDVDADKISFTAEELKDLLPENYEFGYSGEAIMPDGNGNYVVNYVIRQIKTEKEIGVNFWDVENNTQAGEDKVIVDIDANNVGMSEIKDLVPEGY